MALKKSELYSSLWSSCDELRGGMDASQYKDYVLVLLFVKYISDRYAGQPYAPIRIREGASFGDMVALKGNPEIGDLINKNILRPLAEDNALSDMPDFNDSTKLGDGKEKVERLTNLIAIFENPALDFSKNRADGDDLLGDAYEYLMRHFATESGKSKGQFYTPAEVSRVIAQTLGIRHANPTNDTSVYDPTCGSGSLLLKVGEEARHDKDVKVTLFGQEKDNATAGLARMNMVLHDYATADIKQGNTLANPLYLNGDALQTFDYVVANPPFSDKRWSTGLDAENDPWQRFQTYGVPPGKQGDYAYLLHILRSLKPNGKGACILPHGVLFRGNVEAAIRRKLVQYGYIKGIIGLPPNLFYGTGIPACIVVLDKEGANARKGIFMIDASKGFIKDGNKNRLREQDVHKIVDTFAKQAEVPRYARMVPVREISDHKNDYNLNLPRYIDSTEPEDIQDIDGHLRGGIPNRDIEALDRYWQIIPGVRSELFKPLRENYSQLAVAQSEIKQTILSHPEFTAFNESVNELFCKWKEANTPKLKAIDKNGRPKALIEMVAEHLLATFRGASLLDAYDVYQHLMDYWAETMQDDCYLIAADGWRDASQPRLIVEAKNKKTKTRPDFVLGKKKYQAELIPPALVVRRRFAEEQAAIEKLEAELAALEQQIEEMSEEQGGEEGLLSEAANEKGKITKAGVLIRLIELKREDPDDDTKEEREALESYLELVAQQVRVRHQLWDAQEELIEQVAAKYPKFTDDEIKSLVVDDKWMATLVDTLHGEIDRVSQTLTGRIRQLAERYATPLPQLEDEVDAFAARVEGHLKRMGAVWK
ncbi:MAG TPA: type I restriction-modification system subunit M [Pyrinomonadaceae bacterium]|nr:type I restriction-modification system subunit M [Pyrinomonadaceae bacterium]